MLCQLQSSEKQKPRKSKKYNDVLGVMPMKDKQGREQE